MQHVRSSLALGRFASLLLCAPLLCCVLCVLCPLTLCYLVLCCSLLVSCFAVSCSTMLRSTVVVRTAPRPPRLLFLMFCGALRLCFIAAWCVLQSPCYCLVLCPCACFAAGCRGSSCCIVGVVSCCLRLVVYCAVFFGTVLCRVAVHHGVYFSAVLSGIVLFALCSSGAPRPANCCSWCSAVCCVMLR